MVRNEIAGFGVQFDEPAVGGDVLSAEDLPGLADEETRGGGGGYGFEPFAGLGCGEEAVGEDGVG